MALLREQWQLVEFPRPKWHFNQLVALWPFCYSSELDDVPFTLEAWLPFRSSVVANAQVHHGWAWTQPENVWIYSPLPAQVAWVYDIFA